MKQGEEVCNNCTLKEFKYVKPYFTPNKQIPILFVGQAPGKTEAITGVPFTGPAGKMLWRVMHEAGINKLKVDLTNVAKCTPPDDRKPTAKEATCCRDFLKQDIHTSQPKLIVALGDVASKALVGKAKIQSIRGTFEPLREIYEYDCEVLCALHPSFVMRKREWIPIAIQDMIKALQYVVKGKIEVSSDYCTFETDFDEHQLARYLEEASKHPTAFDTETTGLNPRKDTVIGASLCFEENRAIAFDLFEYDPKWQPLKKYLEDKDAKKITQNGQFDNAMLDSHGINVRGLTFDTRLAEHLISSDLPGSLDFLRSKYTSIKPYKPTGKELKEISTWSRDRRLSYGCLDALTTYLVYLEQCQFLDEGNTKVLQEIEIPLTYVLNKMEKKGVLVDTDKLQQLHDEYEPKVQRFLEVYFDPIGINPNSYKQLCQLFSVPSTEEDLLKGYIKNNHKDADLMKILLDYRDVKKILSVYIDGVLERLEYGRIHAHGKVGGAGTGRLSFEDPNLQNIPKPLRALYVADPGFRFIDGDYEQLEVRVLAVVAQEKTMLKEIANGLNIHHKMGKIIFKQEWDKLEEKQRVWTKNVVFGTAYGRGPTAIARQFGCTIREASEWQSACLQQYPNFLVYHQKQRSVFEKTQRAYTPFGRSRLIQTITQAYNTPIQSAGSDICLTSLIMLDKAGFDLRFTVHDSITIQAPEEEYKEQAIEMEKIMSRLIPEMNNMSFPVKLTQGLNWYDLEEII